MKIVGVIQARTGSTRLPGKMLYPLDGEPVIGHIIQRSLCAETLDEVVVATSNRESDAVIVDVAQNRGVPVYRGDEADVLSRMLTAAEKHEADIVVRICGDNPLLSPRCIDVVVTRLVNTGTDYVSNNLKQTFPTGLDTEALTMESFRHVDSVAEEPRLREHATLWYKMNKDELSLENVEVSEVFPDQKLLSNPDLRLTLDRVDDYRLLQRVYDQLSRDERGIIDVVEAVNQINENNLSNLNKHIEQHEPK